MAKFKKGDKVRLVRDDGDCYIPNEYRTKELTVDDDDDDIPNLTCDGENADAEEKRNLIPANAVIHTKTQGEYDQLMEELEKVGYRWSNGKKATEINQWKIYEEKTVIGLDGGLGFADTDGFYVKSENCPIIPFTEIFGEVEEKCSNCGYLESGKVIETNEGGYCIECGKDCTLRFKPEEWILEEARASQKEAIKKVYREWVIPHFNNTKPKKSMLQRATGAIKRLLDKDSQKLYKAGLMNGGLELSSEGRQSYINNLFQEKGDHAKAFKAMVEESEEIIKEAEEN